MPQGWVVVQESPGRFTDGYVWDQIFDILQQWRSCRWVKHANLQTTHSRANCSRILNQSAAEGDECCIAALNPFKSGSVVREARVERALGQRGTPSPLCGVHGTRKRVRAQARAASAQMGVRIASAAKGKEGG